MRVRASLMRAAAGAVLSLAAFAAAAADYPAPKEGTFVAKDFRFHTGEVLPEVRLHYRTVGEPTGEPVVVLHGTSGSGASMLTPAFAGELFGEGQPLDAKKHFIVLPDAIGHGKSTKPSDGLKAKFPKYNAEDMVDGQYRLLTEGLGLKHVRLIIGNSMGGMHAWIWAGKHPDYMDALVPMASQPTPMAARNWMMRRLMIETIRQDPGYENGDYTAQPQRDAAGQRLLRHRHQRRHAGLPEAGTDARAGRQAGRRAPGGPLRCRRQRLHLCLGVLGRLRPDAVAGAHQGPAAPDQLRRRRAQPARDRHHGSGDEARAERPPAS